MDAYIAIRSATRGTMLLTKTPIAPMRRLSHGRKGPGFRCRRDSVWSRGKLRRELYDSSFGTRI